MKREILFRGKSINTGEWVESMTISKGTIKRKKDDVFMEIEENKYIGIYPDSLSQFTGMKDKANEKIFEGDILKGVSSNEFSKGDVNNYEVMWGIDSWHIKGTSFSLQELFNYCNGDVIAIGHIFEDKYLIGKRV